MQLTTLLVSALLPIGLLATPTPDAAEAGPQSLEARQFKRPQHCTIVGGAATVNCRSMGRTSSKVVRKLKRGQTYDFWCVRSDECVTINGFRNCGWHWIRDFDCYVSGHYTDSRCTLARLGSCAGPDDDDAADPF